MSGRAVSPAAAVGILARLTARRLLRTRSLWLSVILVSLPVLFLLAIAQGWDASERWRWVIGALNPVLGIIVPLNLAAIIAEEAEQATFSYLWSRPIPRWTVAVGKSLALLPFVIALMIASIAAGWAISTGGDHPDWLIRGIAAAIIGCLATGAVSVALGTLIRRQAVAASVALLLVIDLPLGKIPLSISNLSITGHFHRLATGDAIAAPIIWLAAMTALWTALALWRVGRVELTAR